MYASGIENLPARTALIYLCVSLFCALFGAAYELFSHEVYSFFMIYAFAFPLTGGALPFLVMSVCRTKRVPGSLSRNLYHSGIATLTVGSIIQGVLDIYGTTNSLIRFYWMAGVALFSAGILAFIFQRYVYSEGYNDGCSG